MANILLVDDDPDVLVTLRAILEEAGHIVQPAATNVAAHDIIGRGGLHLIVADAVLRGGNGDDLANSASDLGVPILLISGEPARLERLRRGRIRFLAKPFRADALITAVSDLLAGRRI